MPALPSVIAVSRIFAEGGALRLPGLLAPADLAELETDALRVRASGRRNVLDISSAAEDRGGNPDRAFTTAHGGPSHWRTFTAATLVSAVREICGVICSPAGGGTYTYYEPGDFLGLHRDIERCDLTVISCLRQTGQSGGGALRVYSRHMEEPLSRARAAGRDASIEVPLARGESLALLGGFVPHEVTPMQPGQERIVAIMCYAIPL
jgi:hypothetical protein